MENLELNERLLREAWYWTSFDPEKRAETFRQEYYQALDILKANIESSNITEEQKADCYEYWSKRLKKEAEEYLCKHSRCISSFIVGPANFQVRKAERANESAQKALNAYVYTLNKTRTKDIFERYLTTEQKQQQIDTQKWKELYSTINDFIWYKTITKEDIAAGKWAYNAFPHLKGQFTTQAKNGNFNMCQKVLDVLLECESQGIKVKKNIEILSLILKEYQQKYQESKENPKQNQYQTLPDGVEIVENIEQNRLQILFPDKPTPEVIAKLKRSAFKWSPRNQAWQRILTPAAKASIKNIFTE